MLNISIEGKSIPCYGLDQVKTISCEYTFVHILG